jgi:two-component system, LytTR family, response regulator
MRQQSLRTIVVDDERIARQVLREELAEMDGVDVIAEAENGIDALRVIESLKPDVVLLDLQMPGKGGFEVIRELVAEPLPTIVIVTAFDQYAIEAFDAGAVDYLLKPVSAERLSKCMERIRLARRNAAGVAAQMSRLQTIAHQVNPGHPRKVVAKSGEEFHLLDTSQVMAFQAERELVWIVTSKQRYLATQPLKQIQEKLAGLNFARIHRNALVNLDHVAKMAPLSSQRWLLTLSNAQEFIVSKRQARGVQKLLSW